MTAHLDEEKIRGLLLLFLNGQFEGAAGEVLSAAGKTGILIRADGRNVFIAECSTWKGPETVRDALGQLLSCLTWRRTKAAIIAAGAAGTAGRQAGTGAHSRFPRQRTPCPLRRRRFLRPAHIRPDPRLAYAGLPRSGQRNWRSTVSAGRSDRRYRLPSCAVS